MGMEPNEVHLQKCFLCGKQLVVTMFKEREESEDYSVVHVIRWDCGGCGFWTQQVIDIADFEEVKRLNLPVKLLDKIKECGIPSMKKKLSDIVINTDKLEETIQNCVSKVGVNPACSLTGYWEHRMNMKIREALKTFKKLPYGYVGDGWPVLSDQSFARAKDKRNLMSAFHEDDWNTRDVGDAVYQANLLLDFLPDEELSIVDFGGGYGRLAIPILYHSSKITYISIDFVPESLVIAPQVINQMFMGTKNHQFQSTPAWNIEAVSKRNVKLFISVHSFQEMTIEAIRFYTNFADKFKGAYLYSINLWPEEKYVPDTWELIFDRAFPINRDGSYNEKLWRIK